MPNEYTVYLSTEDRAKLEGYERSLEQELSGYLLEHARRRGYDLLTRPEVEFDTDERLRLGEFGIQTRLVKPPAREGEAPSRAKRATRWSTRPCASATAAGPKRPEQAVGALVATRAIVSLDDRRYVLDGPRATLGRSKSVECVLADPNVSRRHAELRRAESGDWQIVDLGSTNGIKVNGRRVASTRLSPGRPGHGRHHHLHLRHRAVTGAGRKVLSAWTTTRYPSPSSSASSPSSTCSCSVIARSALKDLRRTVAPAPDATGFHAAPASPRRRAAPTPGWSSSAAAA